MFLQILRSLYGGLLEQWPDLIGTFYGVLLGGLATFGIVRWQINEERRNREENDREFLALLVEHVNREIGKNLRVLRDLEHALDQSPEARLEVWDWAVTIVGSFSSQAHDDLYRTGLQRYLPSEFEEEIRNANAIVFDIRNRARQARAHHTFNQTYRPESRDLNAALFADVKSTLAGADVSLARADRIIDPDNLPWTVDSRDATRSGRGPLSKAAALVRATIPGGRRGE